MDSKRHLPVKLVTKKNKTVELVRLPKDGPRSNQLVSPFTTSSNSVDSTDQYYNRALELGPLAMPRLQSTKVLRRNLEKVMSKPSKVIIEDERILRAIDDKCVNKNLNFPLKQAVFSNLPAVEVNIDDVVKKAEDLAKKKVKATRPPSVKKDPEPKLSDYGSLYLLEEKPAVSLPIPNVDAVLLDFVKDETEGEASTLVEAKDVFEDAFKHYKLSFMD